MRILWLMLLGLLPATAGAVEWTAYAEGDLEFEGSAVNGAAAILYGSGPGDDTSGTDAWVLSVDTVGTVRWGLAIGYPGEEKFLGVATGGGAVLLVGHTDHYGAGGKDGLVVRADDGGGIIFQKTIGGAEDDEFHGTGSGEGQGFLVVGRSGGAAWLVKIDIDANVEWDMTVDLGPDDDIATDAIFNGGSWYVPTIGTGGVGLIKVSADGTLEFAQTFGGATSARPRISGDGGGGYFITGALSDGPSGGEDALLLKVGEIGGIEWAATAGGPGDDRATGVVMAEDLRPVVSMWSDDGGVDGGVVKFDTGGLLFDSSRWADPSVDAGAMGIAQYDDGSLVLAGTSGMVLKGSSLGLVEGCDAVGGGPWQGGTPAFSTTDVTATTGSLGAASVAAEPDDLPRLEATIDHSCAPDLPITDIDPSEWDFGVLSLDESATADFAVTNVGPSALVIDSVDLAGVAAAAYTVEADTCSGATLNEGDPACTITVGFQPLVDGAHDARLEVTSNDPLSENGVVPLDGEGLVVGDDDDDDDDTADDDDSASGDDDDSTTDPGCTCNSAGGASLGLLILLPLVRRRVV